jgi:hypothetical protein
MNASSVAGAGAGASPGGSGGNGNIRVVVRVRPLVPSEVARGEGAVLRAAHDGRTLDAVTARIGDKETLRRFEFDVVAGPHIAQAAFFEASGIPRLMDAALEGINVSVFAYGQTGSGKTYSEWAAPARPSCALLRAGLQCCCYC